MSRAAGSPHASWLSWGLRERKCLDRAAQIGEGSGCRELGISGPVDGGCKLVSYAEIMPKCSLRSGIAIHILMLSQGAAVKACLDSALGFDASQALF